MTAPEEIHNISHSQLSIALHFGGCKYMGASYHYDASHDALIRMNVWQRRMHEDSAAGVACVNTGRKFIGIEQDTGYFQISTDRINAATPTDKHPT